MDSIFKFVTTKTCLDRIHELKHYAKSDAEYMKLVNDEFKDKSVVADWGNMRTYIVHDIDFDQNPVSYTFEFNGT